MKRSEAEKLIEDIIESNLDIMVGEVPNSSLVAGFILYALEQKGMLPPLTNKGDYAYLGDYKWDAE